MSDESWRQRADRLHTHLANGGDLETVYRELPAMRPGFTAAPMYTERQHQQFRMWLRCGEPYRSIALDALAAMPPKEGAH